MAATAIQTKEQKSQSTWALAMRRFRKHRMAMISIVIIVLLIAMAVFAPFIAPYDPTSLPTSGDLSSLYNQSPSAQHWLGTDDLGRDVFSRLVYGSRVTLLVGFVGALGSAIIGMILGALSGFYSGRPFSFFNGPFSNSKSSSRFLSVAWRVISVAIFYGVLAFVVRLGWILSGEDVKAIFGGTLSFANILSLVGLLLTWGVVGYCAFWGLRAQFKLDLDVALSRLMDLLLSIPGLPLQLVLSALMRDSNGFLGKTVGSWLGEYASVATIIFIVVVFGWIGTARLVRGAVLSLREQEFTSAAQALGAGDWRIVLRHLLPNSVAQVIVATTLGVGDAITTEAALSFLGFGVQPPAATWGNMLNNAQNWILDYPWLALGPGAAIFLTVLAFNYLGDGLRDALDPRSRL